LHEIRFARRDDLFGGREVGETRPNSFCRIPPMGGTGQQGLLHLAIQRFEPQRRDLDPIAHRAAADRRSPAGRHLFLPVKRQVIRVLAQDDPGRSVPPTRRHPPAAPRAVSEPGAPRGRRHLYFREPDRAGRRHCSRPLQPAGEGRVVHALLPRKLGPCQPARPKRMDQLHPPRPRHQVGVCSIAIRIFFAQHQVRLIQDC
jgi:hypothetical protein